MGVAVRFRMNSTVRAAGAAGLGASAQGLVDNGFEGAGAAAAFGAAAQAAVDLLGIAGKVFRAIDRVANIVVSQDVAGTNNHETTELFNETPWLIDIQDTGGMQKEKPLFQAIPNCCCLSLERV